MATSNSSLLIPNSTKTEKRAQMDRIKKVVLAYSGGLDTSVIIPWLKENYRCQVVAFISDVGQGKEVGPAREKALRTGAVKAVVKDQRKDFLENFCFPALRAQAKYEGSYLLVTSLARPIIAKGLVETALREEAEIGRAHV